jgi:hypothetical protein
LKEKLLAERRAKMEKELDDIADGTEKGKQPQKLSIIKEEHSNELSKDEIKEIQREEPKHQIFEEAKPRVVEIKPTIVTVSQEIQTLISIADITQWQKYI